MSDANADELPLLLEEFSRATADLVAAHDALLEEVDSLKQELAVKNRRLERKKRLEEIGRVAAGVAHEFRNPLGGVRLRADRLMKDAPDDATRGRVGEIQAAVTHLDRIVEDLLTYTRNEELSLLPQPLRPLVDHALQLAFPDPDTTPARLVCDGGDLHASVDGVTFTQVLVNLVVNAAQAAAAANEAADVQVGLWWGERDGTAWLEVADNGPGIPAGEEERIFHPFHTLKVGGTGLGLAIVHSRVEAHDGEVAVVADAWGGGADWEGARFRITLPSLANRNSESETNTGAERNGECQES